TLSSPQRERVGGEGARRAWTEWPRRHGFVHRGESSPPITNSLAGDRSTNPPSPAKWEKGLGVRARARHRTARRDRYLRYPSWPCDNRTNLHALALRPRPALGALRSEPSP